MNELGAQLEAAESKLAGLRSNLEVLQEHVAVEEERVTLLRRLLELDMPEQRRPVDDAHAAAKPNDSSRSKAMSLEDAVISILADRPESVHIGEIHAELRKRGIRIPGKGVDANIIARIIKEPRIERESGRRGYYRLAKA